MSIEVVERMKQEILEEVSKTLAAVDASVVQHQVHKALRRLKRCQLDELEKAQAIAADRIADWERRMGEAVIYDELFLAVGRTLVERKMRYREARFQVHREIDQQRDALNTTPFLKQLRQAVEATMRDSEASVPPTATEARTEMLFIIDKSGSMRGQEKAVVEGFNKVIAEQREVPGDDLVTTVFFDSRPRTLYSRVPLAEVAQMEHTDYRPSGATALLDTVGESVRQIFEAQRADDASKRPTQTLVVIMTDGEENASSTYKQTEIKQIAELLQQHYGWTFLYFGANVDHFAEANALGINRDCAYDFEADAAGIELCMASCSQTLKYRRVGEREKLRGLLK